MLGFFMAAGIFDIFELTYGKTRLASKAQRYLAHAAKFLLSIAIATLMWIAHKTMSITGGYFNDWIFFPV